MSWYCCDDQRCLGCDDGREFELEEGLQKGRTMALLQTRASEHPGELADQLGRALHALRHGRKYGTGSQMLVTDILNEVDKALDAWRNAR